MQLGRELNVLWARAGSMIMVVNLLRTRLALVRLLRRAWWSIRLPGLGLKCLRLTREVSLVDMLALNTLGSV